mmetsp:Transcript_41382/g.95899  ORF Transcript_41382/g.95899 Transcript_41382/m.95899 type:complete len:298 (+) Transcript_41382:1152-2045(+)
MCRRTRSLRTWWGRPRRRSRSSRRTSQRVPRRCWRRWAAQLTLGSSSSPSPAGRMCGRTPSGRRRSSPSSTARTPSLPLSATAPRTVACTSWTARASTSSRLSCSASSASGGWRRAWRSRLRPTRPRSKPSVASLWGCNTCSASSQQSWRAASRQARTPPATSVMAPHQAAASAATTALCPCRTSPSPARAAHRSRPRPAAAPGIERVSSCHAGRCAQDSSSRAMSAAPAAAPGAECGCDSWGMEPWPGEGTYDASHACRLQACARAVVLGQGKQGVAVPRPDSLALLCSTVHLLLM